MKRWIWLVVLPYVVQVSSGHYRIPYKSEKRSFYMECGESEKDYCYDFAEALNAAHERRMPHPHGTSTLTYTTAPWVDPCPGCGDPGIMPALPPGTYNPCQDGACK